MKIHEILTKKRTLSFEFFPPKTEEKSNELQSTIENIKRFNPDFVSITDSGIFGKTKHIALSLIIKENYRFNTMIHLTCINNTKEEITKIIKEIKKNNIENILVLKGDLNNTFHFHRDFSNSLDLLPLIPEDISKGVAVYPSSHPDTPMHKDIELLKKKIELGANFGITQMFFDISEIEKFLQELEKNRIKIPIIAGLLPPTSPEIFKNIILKVKNISIPKELKKLIENFEDETQKKQFFEKSMDFMIKLVESIIKIKEIKGIHFFTLNKNKGVEYIIENTNLCKKLNL